MNDDIKDDIKRDIDFFTLYDNEGRPLETFTVEVPTDEELRDYWLITTEEGVILGTHQTRIGRVKPDEILCNRRDMEGACCYQVSREEFEAAAGTVRNGEPSVDGKFSGRFVRAEVRGEKVRKRISEEEWQEANPPAITYIEDGAKVDSPIYANGIGGKEIIGFERKPETNVTEKTREIIVEK